jgi:hypothetical protein
MPDKEETKKDGILVNNNINNNNEENIRTNHNLTSAGFSPDGIFSTLNNISENDRQMSAIKNEKKINKNNMTIYNLGVINIIDYNNNKYIAVWMEHNNKFCYLWFKLM